MAAVSCPLCGAPNATCGGQGTTHGVGISFGKAAPMSDPGPLKPYTLHEGDPMRETTLLLSDEDAKRRGLIKSAEKQRRPANKARTPPNK